MSRFAALATAALAMLAGCASDETAPPIHVQPDAGGNPAFADTGVDGVAAVDATAAEALPDTAPLLDTAGEDTTKPDTAPGPETTSPDTSLEVAGEDTGPDTSGPCTLPTEFGPLAFHIATVALGDSGHYGNGLDIDQDASTCAPEKECSGGIDNACAGLAIVLNDVVQEDLDTQETILLGDMPGFNKDGELFQLRAFQGKTPPDCAPDRDPSCVYQVTPTSFGADCKPLLHLDNAWFSATDQISAGGKDSVFVLPLPVPGQDPYPKVTVHRATLRAKVKWAGTQIISLEGVIGGAANKEEMLEVLDLVPEGSLPIDVSYVKQLLDAIFEADQDVDGDGELESISFGLKFTAEPASITGVSAP